MTRHNGGDVLDDDERARVDHLADLSDDDYELAVEDYVLRPDSAGRAVFRCPELAERTLEAVTRLRHTSAGRLEVTDDRQQRDYLAECAGLFRAEQQQLGPAVNRARQEAARTGTRQQAYRLLAELHYREFRRIRRRLDDGAAAEQVLRELREPGP